MKALSRWVAIVAFTSLSFGVFAQSDPTAPLGYDAPSKATKTKTYRLPRLDAILCGGNNACSAVINGRSVSKGQSINGYFISAIHDNSVTLKRGERRWSLTVFNEQVVQ
ncbi:MSHA biogenesis protein MshK [Enterovibrio sp. ZSDZ42]|uniref:MSHA biogenesis protein MshK n=1 Tax=Enterovibrio gelatinilyticus TaxID=2899819 RepID=A0ABT5QVM3_9GAMM|nr:MSHA biogenesis protein MshK [Enterovibrio sp. ZSDZ42]MDD1792061.1 MSHA biogenesis protein MshK [Enterovibrio sp. ZSDZ42]